MGNERHPSGLHQSEECKQVEKIARLESKVDDHDRRLQAGALAFVEMRGDIKALTKAVTDAVDLVKTQAAEAGKVNWGHEILRAIINWGVPVGVLVLVWALVGSGAVSVKGAP